MPLYNVHLYREMRLFFPGIEADTPDEAAKMVALYPSDEAESYEDCEGVTLAALVDLVGDEDFSESVAIDLDPMKVAVRELYDLLEEIHPLLLAGTFYDNYDEATSKVGRISKLLAKARGKTLPEAAQHQNPMTS
jgi:hypothetical protein